MGDDIMQSSENWGLGYLRVAPSTITTSVGLFVANEIDNGTEQDQHRLHQSKSCWGVVPITCAGRAAVHLHLFGDLAGLVETDNRRILADDLGRRNRGRGAYTQSATRREESQCGCGLLCDGLCTSTRRKGLRPSSRGGQFTYINHVGDPRIVFSES
ncbi:hypothetical protein BJV74DRAFT_192224 [Russula compacta]|nr:hypothetical protein BJV74DRAFT_192224 [Russula compacta]